MITGGLGFLGSSLAHELKSRNGGVSLTLVDSEVPGLGANSANLDGLGEHRLERIDVRGLMNRPELMRGVTKVFHCAGQGDHGASMRDPVRDLELNAGGTLAVLEAVRRHAPDARVVTLGTRAEYGRVESLPVGETAPTRPLGCYAVSKLAATGYAQVYAEALGLDVVATRLTNIYGPRAQVRHPGYGVANWFIRQAVAGDDITLFGDGAVRRDYVYVDDAVDALISLGAAPAARGGIFNVGGTRLSSLRELAEAAMRAAGTGGRIRFAPYPAHKRALEPGDFQADATALRRVTGWAPTTDLEHGMAKSVAFYRRRWARYVDTAAA